MRTLLLTILALTLPAIGKENAYDVVGKVLTPFGQVLAQSSKTANRAVTLNFHAEGGRNGTEAKTLPVRLSLEAPDRLRVTATLEGEEVTVCRRGQEIWAYPGSRVKALLEDPAVLRKLPAADSKFKLAPFALPIPEKQLAFLPVLFKVQEVGDFELGGEVCRVLDLRLMPELMKAVPAKQGFVARIWVAPQYRLAQVDIATTEGRATMHVDELSYARALPPATWQPTAEQSGDIIPLQPKVYDQLIRGFLSP